jgi:hypothetical protein
MEKERVVKDTSRIRVRTFDDVMRRILSVSHVENLGSGRRVSEYQRKRAKKKQAKP